MTSAAQLSPWPEIFREYDSAEQLVSVSVIAVANEICAVVGARGACHMIVPGGGSPLAFFVHLTSHGLRWPHLHL